MDLQIFLQQEKEKLNDIKIGFVGTKDIGIEGSYIKDDLRDAVITAINDGCQGIVPIEKVGEFDVPKRYDVAHTRVDSYVPYPLVRGILEYLDVRDVELRGKMAVLINENIFVDTLIERGMTTCVCGDDSDDSDVSGLLCDADLVIIGDGDYCRGQMTKAIVFYKDGTFEEDEIIGTWSEKIPEDLEEIFIRKNLEDLIEFQN